MNGESELRSITDVEQKLSEVDFPFEEVLPPRLMEWFNLYAASHGTTRKLLLVSALASTSALIGNSTVEVFPTYEEIGNLFIVAVAPSGAGKSPACHYGRIDPIVNHVEQKFEHNIVLDVASANGMFNHIASSAAVPILCVDEAHTFLLKLTSPSKHSDVNLTMERLCKCFDGDCWYVLKGNKGKRTGVSSARVSLLALTTPRQFLENAWPKILKAENGLADRFLFIYEKKEERDLEEMADLSQQFQNQAVRTFKGVFEQIFMEHNSDEQLKYMLSEDAKEAFFKFSKPQENALPSSYSASAGHGDVTCKNSKRNKHVLRLALNMHILYSRLEKALNLQTGPTAKGISLTTMNMAVTLVESLETYKGISETARELYARKSTVKVGCDQDDIQRRILATSGPYTTATRVTASFSSRFKPRAGLVHEAMRALAAEGLGTHKVLNRLHAFYKSLPHADLQPKLAKWMCMSNDLMRKTASLLLTQ